MNKREENKYTMYKAVEKILDENISIVNTIPALLQAVNKFKTALNDLSDKDNDYLNITKGSADKKKSNEVQLIDRLINISGALYVYARSVKNEELISISKLNKSSLTKIRDTELLQTAKAIYQKANENKTNLETYGVSSTDITDFNDKLKAYDDSLSSRESKSAQSKTARKALKKEFDNVDDILKEDIDNLVRLLNEKNPKFYEDYKSSRVIKDI